MIKQTVRHLLPARIIQWYHLMLARLANIRYGHPSHELIVIGVTGTNGKSTTVEYISQLLYKSGARVGHLATTTIRIAESVRLNKTKMTMLGRFTLQKYLRQMVDAGCTYAVVEVTSQGLEQHRARGIEFDVAVFTNLTPEHIEAHGSFEKYARAKEKLFDMVQQRGDKLINKKPVQTTSIINLDDDQAKRYGRYMMTTHFGFTRRDSGAVAAGQTIVAAQQITYSAAGSSFTIQDTNFNLPILGNFNVANALAAISVGLSFGFRLADLADWLATFEPTPGRLELIETSQPFTVMVDQAPEPVSLAKVFDVVALLQPARIIHVLGSTGGGRDKFRRPLLGQLSVSRADVTFITNEDPYDEDPLIIMQQIAEGARQAGARENENMFVVADRRQAIRRAIAQAEPKDLVLITGKGSEQAIVVKNNKKIPWDDREVVREELKR
jgi:UDP-N-acetylmuramoyl-L-alanyl-D-glutamate--2,6-diaminopimelate ligase